MATSRDDFIIAIRSAFLKKSTQQKFSLLSLLLISISIIVLSNLNFKVIKYVKIGLNEVVYRSSFLVSIPENFVKNSFFEIKEYSSFFNEYKKNKKELDQFKSNYVSNEIMQFENKELKELIDDFVSSSNKILAKIIVDHKSPYLKSIIINKGSKDNIKIGTNIYDQSYLIGRVIEVNYKTSRVLLLSDLNSNVPVTIAPQNVQAIITGTGKNDGKIKYIKGDFSSDLSEENIIYSSGTGGVFKSGIPIGKLKIKKDESTRNMSVQFYSDFSQLKYVFAEIISKKDIEDLDQVINQTNTTDTKLKLLEDEIEIIEDTNLKFLKENETLKFEINNLNTQISSLKDQVFLQKKEIDKFNFDEKELEFLRLNLIYGHKCRKTFLNSSGFKINTLEYRECVLNKGIIN